MSDIGRVTKITKLKINFGNINNDMKQRSKTGFECNKYAFDSLDSLVTSAIIEAVLWHQELLNRVSYMQQYIFWSRYQRAIL